VNESIFLQWSLFINCMISPTKENEKKKLQAAADSTCRTPYLTAMQMGHLFPAHAYLMHGSTYIYTTMRVAACINDG
jgi:hypothetical protein